MALKESLIDVQLMIKSYKFYKNVLSDSCDNLDNRHTALQRNFNDENIIKLEKEEKPVTPISLQLYPHFIHSHHISLIQLPSSIETKYFHKKRE